jgi:hypothetical protein
MSGLCEAPHTAHQRRAALNAARFALPTLGEPVHRPRCDALVDQTPVSNAGDERPLLRFPS